jgi:hypothetical protein
VRRILSVCEHQPINDVLDELAAEHDLADSRGTSASGLPERYLYSRDIQYRYAFARWWAAEDPVRT